MDLVAEVTKKMDERRNSKQYFAEAYYRYKKAMDEFQRIMDRIIESGDGVELNRLASAIECDVDSFGGNNGI